MMGRRSQFGACFFFVIGLCWLLCASQAAFAQDKSRPKQADSDQKKLGQKLLRKATAGADEDLMQRIMSMMADSARRLEIDFDAGQETRSVQDRVIASLDEAIKIAAAQRRPRKQRRPRPKGDKRRMAKAGKGEKEKASESKARASGSASAKAGALSGRGPGVGQSGGDIAETRRAWGHLPARDREEIIQGSAEGFLDRYRELIERYYRVLQESDE